jgi:hypothetical protein
MNQSYSNSKNGKTLTIPAWRACITMRLRKDTLRERSGDKEEIETSDIITALREIQNIQIKRDYLYLSAYPSFSESILGDWSESVINLTFANDPKFPETNSRLRDGVIEIADYLMNKFEKNDILILFDDDAVVLQNGTQHYWNSREYKRSALWKCRALTDDELAEEFNRYVGIKCFNFYLQGAMGAVWAELRRRKIDYSDVGSGNTLSFAQKVKIIDGKLTVM